MNRTALFFVIPSTALILALTACTPGKEDKPPTPKVTASAEIPGPLPKFGPAPAWKLQDLNGNVVSSEQFAGKVVVIDFWATWCGPCRMEIPGYAELTRKYGKEGLVIIGVSLDEGGPDVVKPFAEKMKINYPLAMGDEKVTTAFGGIEGLPTTFIIDRTGQVRHRKVGAEETAEYEKKVLAVLRERA